ncbi:unnamed protein product [Closterium sp. NIES-54]
MSLCSRPHPQRPVLVVSGGVGGAVAEGEGTGAAGAGGVSSGGAGGVGVEVTPVENTAVLTRQPRPASPPGFPSVPQFPPRSSLQPVAAEPGGVLAGGTGGPGGVGAGGAGSGGAGAGGTGTVAPTPRTVRFRTPQESRSQQQVRLQLQQERAEEEPQEQQQGQVPSQQTPEEAERQRLRLRDLPDPAPARLVCGPLLSPPVPPVLFVPQCVSRPVVQLPPCLSSYVSRVLSALVTHQTAPLSSVSALVTTVAGFASSHRLDYAAHLVSGPGRSPFSGGAPDFPLEVLEDRQFELGFLVADVPHLCAMLLALEGDPDAVDTPIPRTHAEAVSGP